MDVVGGVIVAAQSSKAGGLKRSMSCAGDDSGQPAWRRGVELEVGWRTTQYPQRHVPSPPKDEGSGHHGLRSVLQAQPQSGFGMGGNSGGGMVKSEGLTAGNFEQGSGNSSTITDGGLFFWASAPCTYGSCLLKPPDPFPGTGGGGRAGNDSGSASSPERGKAFPGERSDGEPPPSLKRAIRSTTYTGSRKHQEGIAGSAGSVEGRLERSASMGLSMDRTNNTSTIPFYRNPSLFAKPQARLWIEPLQFLLKKELTVTDVGELGRIILPKRDAECQLPHLDSKEGKLLAMEDYNSNKQWTLRYKWWPNNKSRMYVLESTGEFVKYYDLKEKDELVLFRDACGNLVIRGLKISPSLTTRYDCVLGPTSFKGRSTGKRSPKGPSGRNIYKNGSSTASSSNSSAQASNSNHQFLDSSHEHESSDGLDFKLGPANPSQPLVTQVTQGMAPQEPLQPKLSLDCGLLSGSVLSTSVLSTSILSTSVLSTSVLQYHVDQSEITPITMGSFPSVAGHSDGAIDWEKLPDPPVNLIEFPDPAAIELPIGEFECSWAEFN